ncbi:MAG: CotH kinase family protein [Verrucomicrobiales bacterium]
MRTEPLDPLARTLCHGCLILAGLTADSAAASVRLSELMAGNDGALRDEDGEASDWIELHNAGAGSVSLEGWGLSDRPGQPFKWVFPARVLSGGARLVVFASGKNRAVPSGRLHTNFALAAEGEEVTLTAPDGQRVDSSLAVRLPEGLSYGRAEEVAAAWRFFARPSPGQPNSGESWGEWLQASPALSVAGGFYDEAVAVTGTAGEGQVIRYTLDGSEPVETSPVWPDVLTIASRAGEPNVLSMIQGTSTANQHTDGWKPPVGEVRKATVLRARAFKPDTRPSPVVTHTYFVGPTARHIDGLPVVSLATDPVGLFDYTRGIYMLGKVFDDYVAAHPNEELTGHTPANYTQRGAAWNRPASLEFFGADGRRAFAHDINLDIKGQSTRSFRQKSLGVDVRDADGGRGMIRYPLFPGLSQLGGAGPLETFRTLRLRNMGNDWAYAAMRDAYCHRLAEGLGLVRMAWQPVSVYLDGEYWGVLEMREELDGDYFAAHFGVPRDEVVIVNAPGSVVEGVNGDHSPFVALRTYAESHDLAVPEHYDYVTARLDVDNFLLYQFVEIWCGNADWPHNNNRAWRRRLAEPLDNSSALPLGHDGRWRWLMFDLDLAVAHPWAGGAGENTLAYALSPTGRPPINAPWATAFLRALMKNPEVKKLFASLAADLLNTHFKDTRVTALVDSMRATLQPAMTDHIRRWQSNGNSLSAWTGTHVQSMRNFAAQRSINVRQHFTTQFALGGYASLTTDVAPSGAGHVVVNRRFTIDASLPGVGSPVYPWRGTYFRTLPVNLAAEPAPGFAFAGWRTPNGVSPHREIELTLAGATTATALFVPVPESTRFDLHLVEILPDGRPRLEFQGVPGAAYALESSKSLDAWTRLTTFLTDADGHWEFTPDLTPAPPAAAHYFRIVAP